MMKTLTERFTEKVEEPFDVHNDCWIWKGSKTGSGYGQIWVDGKYVTAHRISYELMVGPIPEGHAVDHLCRNRPCVRPDHLQALEHHENWTQWNLSKTHCPNGHPYGGDNLQVKPSGEWRCRICHNTQERKRNARKRGLKL
jgi:hypothetical protein